jgi:hypothetical protein
MIEITSQFYYDIGSMYAYASKSFTARAHTGGLRRPSRSFRNFQLVKGAKCGSNNMGS